MPMSNNSFREGNIYSASFYKTSLSTGGPLDLWVVYASTAPISRLEVLSIDVSFGSSALPTNPQALALQMLRGSTSGGGGATIAPVNLRGWSGTPTAGSSCTGPSTSISSTASASLVWADVAYSQAGWHFPPPQELTGLARPVLASGQRLALRIDTPQIALVASGTLTFREIGAGLPS